MLPHEPVSILPGHAVLSQKWVESRPSIRVGSLSVSCAVTGHCQAAHTSHQVSRRGRQPRGFVIFGVLPERELPPPTLRISTHFDIGDIRVTD
jgi:hypothetical protein